MTSPNLTTGFVKLLNRHGFAFQYAAIAEAGKAFEQKTSRFAFEAAEVPVRVQTDETKIDFILRHLDRPIALVCECKRVNPVIGNWCFVKAPSVHRDWSAQGVFILDIIQRRQQTGELDVTPTQAYSERSAYQIALEMRAHPSPDQSNTTCESGGSGRAEFEGAVKQALLGTNGLLNFYLSRNDIGQSQREDQGQGAERLILVPVVITTAQLWVSDIDLEQSDLLTGNYPQAKAELRPVDWVVYHHHMSPALKFDNPALRLNGNIGWALQADFVRSIAVVSAAHLRAFVEWASKSLAA